MLSSVRHTPYLVLLINVYGALAAGQGTSAPVERMLSTLSSYARSGNPPGQRVAFEFPEAMVNAYLTMSLAQQPRPGIERATVKLLPANRMTVQADLNFDAMAERFSKKTAESLKGVHAVTIELHFTVQEGKVRIEWDRFLVGDKPLAAPLSAEVVQVLGAMQPEKFNTASAIPLPYGLKRLSTSAGVLSADTLR